MCSVFGQISWNQRVGQFLGHHSSLFILFDIGFRLFDHILWRSNAVQNGSYIIDRNGTSELLSSMFHEQGIQDYQCHLCIANEEFLCTQ